MPTQDALSAVYNLWMANVGNTAVSITGSVFVFSTLHRPGSPQQARFLVLATTPPAMQPCVWLGNRFSFPVTWPICPVHSRRKRTLQDKPFRLY
ncbi:hypothetical protein LEMLEM_LOCUS8320 [Lemmus lemmus]